MPDLPGRLRGFQVIQQTHVQHDIFKTFLIQGMQEIKIDILCLQPLQLLLQNPVEIFLLLQKPDW